MPVASSDVSFLPTTDEFIQRCERARALNYMMRARAQAELPPPSRTAGSSSFGSALVYFVGEWARVHLIDDQSLDQLDAIEAWFSERKLTASFEVPPTLAGRRAAEALTDRNYRLVSWQPTVHRDLSPPTEDSAPRVVVEPIGHVPDTRFYETYYRGYEMDADFAQTKVEQEARWKSEQAERFLALVDGKPAAAATLVMIDDVARFANCATVPEFRGRGAQAALIRARLSRAAELGAMVAIADARQGGVSLRNLARAGFRICAHITQWERRPSG